MQTFWNPLSKEGNQSGTRLSSNFGRRHWQLAATNEADQVSATSRNAEYRRYHRTTRGLGDPIQGRPFQQKAHRGPLGSSNIYHREHFEVAGEEGQGWVVLRIVTIHDGSEVGRLLFVTLSELPLGALRPTIPHGYESFALKGSTETVRFRRTVLAKKEAIAWYLSLQEGECSSPTAGDSSDIESIDATRILVSQLEDLQPWPKLGLPIGDSFFKLSGKRIDNPAPFIGSVPARIHRRFGECKGLEAFLRDENAQAFVARRMHVSLFDYQEYLGSAVYIAPDPIVRKVECFMAPAKGERGERIFYRIIPRIGQSLRGLHLTAIDSETQLLTGFETLPVPDDGILDVEKGSCMGRYGYVLTHEEHGILAYHPPTSFLRQVNVTTRFIPRIRRTVHVALSDSDDAPDAEYTAAESSEMTSSRVIGEVKDAGTGARVAAMAASRERRNAARHYGQRWFPAGSRKEAVDLLRDIISRVRSRLMIADPYLGALQLNQFLYSVHGSALSIQILTTANAFKPKKAMTKLQRLDHFNGHIEDLKAIQNLNPEVRVISKHSLHDRFLVVDDEVWMLGSSLNSLGDKASMIVRLPNSSEVITRLEQLAHDAPDLARYRTMVIDENGRGTQ